MTLEQKPELNRFVDPSIPLTWNYRWRQLKLALPVLIFTWVLLLEMGLFNGWLADKLQWDQMAVLVGVCSAMFLVVFAAGEIQIRIQQRSKRSIKIKDKKIVVQPAKNSMVRWGKILKFQLEPIPETPGLTKLNLFLHGRPNQKPSGRAFWSMVLENPSQQQKLVCYLQIKRTETPSDYEIEILGSPALPKSPAPFPFLEMMLFMGGFFLLLHGIPMLLAILGEHHRDPGEPSKLSPEQIAKLQQVILNHFSSREEFRHFFLMLGSGLTMAGCILLFLGWWLMKRRTQAAPTMGKE